MLRSVIRPHLRERRPLKLEWTRIARHEHRKAHRMPLVYTSSHGIHVGCDLLSDSPVFIDVAQSQSLPRSIRVQNDYWRAQVSSSGYLTAFSRSKHQHPCLMNYSCNSRVTQLGTTGRRSKRLPPPEFSASLCRTNKNRLH